MNHIFSPIRFFALAVILFCLPASAPAAADGSDEYVPDNSYLQDRALLNTLQRDAFKYVWDDSDPHSGMVYEGTWKFDVRPVAVGGTGFAIAAIVTAADRGWISREEAVQRIMKISLFLKNKAPRAELKGAFPHWLDGATGKTVSFGKGDAGADIVETALLMQGLLIARAYFNGPGIETRLRNIITDLWHDVDWNWFTNGEDNGLYWHWSPQLGFRMGLKILGYNECLIAYVLAASSPTHPISRNAYDYWTSGKSYQPKTVYGYKVEAALQGAGPLFLTHYSFIGLDPRRMADKFVPNGYFVRNTRHTLSNRGYCLFNAPSKNLYAEDFWGLSAGQIKGGYAASEPSNDKGVITPTAALSSMPYTPHYSMQVLANLAGKLRDQIWGPFGPYDGISLRHKWVSTDYLAIDQLPIICMVENYRSGLLWRLLMSDQEIRGGLENVGIAEPDFSEGFPELVVTLVQNGKRLVADAHELRRHPDTGWYTLPYYCTEAGEASFTFVDENGQKVHSVSQRSAKGHNILLFAPFRQPDGSLMTLTMRSIRGEYSVPLRLH